MRDIYEEAYPDDLSAKLLAEAGVTLVAFSAAAASRVLSSA